jgi:hypothetical protein
MQKDQITNLDTSHPKSYGSISYSKGPGGHGITNKQIIDATKYLTLKNIKGENKDSIAEKAYYEEKYNLHKY